MKADTSRRFVIERIQGIHHPLGGSTMPDFEQINQGLGAGIGLIGRLADPGDGRHEFVSGFEAGVLLGIDRDPAGDEQEPVSDRVAMIR